MTPAQLATLRTAILADPVLAAQPQTSDGDFAIAEAMNAASNPAYYVWHTAVPVDAIADAILWANFTPSDTPDGTTLWQNRSLACQGKQMNIQTMLIGRTVVNAARPQWRTGLQDALSQLPSGATGTLRNAGWAAVQLVLSRVARRVEVLYATGGAGTQASPATAVIDGAITPQDVEQSGWRA